MAEGKKVDISMNDTENEDFEGDGIVTMVDVLEQENEQEADANAVLGGADDKNCTYAEGPLPRQPLYACKTCCKDSPGGVCLACSYKCHEGHELVELYTKRNFRCDCGNAAFGANACLLDPMKDTENKENAYNQNFQGLYCICARPYPDPEDSIEDEMIQCVVCEDWFHGRHLEPKAPSHDYEEMICHGCMVKLPFLGHYVEAKSTVNTPDSAEVDVLSLDTANKALPTAEAGTSKEGNVTCKIAGLPMHKLKEATYWPAGWRAKLCTCSSCVQLYKTHQVSFLTNDGDSVRSYERRNLTKGGETQYEMGMRALSSLDRVQQIEAIQGYNEMKTALMEHLTKFKGSNRVVSAEDIHEFFEGMKAKRPRLEVQTNCR